MIPIDHSEKSKLISLLSYTTPLKTEPKTLPNSYSLLKVFPNPFNPQITILYNTELNQHNLLQVYNINGKVIKTLVNETQTTGDYQIGWDANDYPSGIYFIKFTSNFFTKTQKIMLIK